MSDDLWRVIDLKAQDPYVIHSVYEAVAYSVSEGASPPTLILIHPAKPYVCVGFHQIPREEVDFQRCVEDNVPVVRRQIGGGTVYLDGGQQFYHVVTRYEAQPLQRFFEKHLEPIVKLYRDYGVKAEYKPLNDIVADGRKISGNGAARIMDAMVLVGNVILDVDASRMVQYLRVPSEKFRDKLVKSMGEWVTSLRRETGFTPVREEVKKRITELFTEALGVSFTPSHLTGMEAEAMQKVRVKLSSEEWLNAWEDEHRPLIEARRVKVKAGLEVVEVSRKGRKLLKALAELKGDRIYTIMLSGDFFVFPRGEELRRLEKALEGLRVCVEDVKPVVEEFWRGSWLEGLTCEDVIQTILSLKP